MFNSIRGFFFYWVVQCIRILLYILMCLGIIQSEYCMSYAFQRWKSKAKAGCCYPTLSLSLIEPFPRMDIFAPVSSCNLFMELPRGPSSFPTKLNCNGEKKKQYRGSLTLLDSSPTSKSIKNIYRWGGVPSQTKKINK